MVAYFDCDLRIRLSNSSFDRNHAAHPGELVGQTVATATGDLYPKIEPALRRVLAGERQTLPLMFGSEGDARWLQATYIPDTNPAGTTVGILAFLEDIDSRTRVEQSLARFKLACDQGMEGFALRDDEGAFTYINPAQASMYGYEPEECLGESWRLFYREDHAQEIEAKVLPQLIEKGCWRGELEGRRKSGEQFDVEVSLTLLVDSAGNPSGLVCNCRDITPRKLAEESVRQLQKIDALGQLTGGVAHDFNNLLTVIIGNLDLLRELPELPAESRELAKHALNAAERGANLTHRLMAFARRQKLNPQVINLRELIDGMEDLLSRSIGERTEVEISHGANLWHCAVDQSQMENAILNLVLNARDAMPSGGVVRVQTRNASDEPAPHGDGEPLPEFIELSVQDSGIGMPSEIRERMFDPFFTTKPAEKGSGLGLSMVHGFINQSGGSIRVTSEPGRGTEITLCLPRTAAPLAAEATPEPPPPSTGAYESILVVEDKPDVRAMVAHMLESLNFTVYQASDGPEAIELAAARSDLDLILADIVLPGRLDGPDVVRMIRESKPNIRGLLMSGFAATDPESTQPLAIIAKPFTRRDLAYAVRQALI